MLGRKGQGALEYLLILAAVLAIAVVVILVAHHVATPAQQSTVVNQDKFSCAQAGIELVNYNSLPSSASEVSVRYQGSDTTQCSSTTKPVSDADASCVIHDANNNEHTLYVKITNPGTTPTIDCSIQWSK